VGQRVTELPATWRRLNAGQQQAARQRGRMRAAVHARSPRRAATGLEPLDPVTSARVAGLRYVNDETMPGIRRVKQKARVRYLNPDGRPVKDAADLQRLRALAIPPAWTDVWICPYANGHLQATGRDARGRKQYRYHARWREVRDEVKYGRLIAFAQALPRIRERTGADLNRPGLPREKVLAAVVQLLEKTLIRVGNEEYARENGSVGLTTMRDAHAKVQGATVRFEFRGKSGIEHAIDLDDRRLARIVKACRDLPGYELFQYIDDDGARQEIDSADVNAYLREISGDDFTAKDFRTWAGTVLAAQALATLDRYKSNAQAKRNVVKAIESVAKRLGNTKSVCRKCYIHPAILDAYMEGGTIQAIGARARLAKNGPALTPEESAVVRVIEQRLRRKTA
jgi:DNA topoisomerase-1